jgi:hypothetical protein
MNEYQLQLQKAFLHTVAANYSILKTSQSSVILNMDSAAT